MQSSGCSRFEHMERLSADFISFLVRVQVSRKLVEVGNELVAEQQSRVIEVANLRSFNFEEAIPRFQLGTYAKAAQANSGENLRMLGMPYFAV